MQLTGYRRAFFHQHQLLLMIHLAFNRQHAGQLFDQGTHQLPIFVIQRALWRMLRNDHPVISQFVTQAPAQRRMIGMLLIVVAQAGAAHRIIAIFRPQRLVAAQLYKLFLTVVFVQAYLDGAQWRQGLQLIEDRCQAAAQWFVGMQLTAGVIQKAQHLILLLQIGGFFCHPLLQPVVHGSQFVGHGVQRAAE
ncbi:hypothetical protein D3C81_723380 [compost metagenome]